MNCEEMARMYDLPTEIGELHPAKTSWNPGVKQDRALAEKINQKLPHALLALFGLFLILAAYG